MVAVPIGLFIWTFVADLAYLATDKNAMWYDISLYSGMAAVITALAAALPGFGDYFTVALKTKAAAMATAHMLLNLAVVALFGVAILMQIDNGALTGTDLSAVIVLHAVGVVILGISGALGGEMVYRQHLAVIPHDAADEMHEEHRHVGRAGV